jgi:aspartyl protease family protein
LNCDLLGSKEQNLYKDSKTNIVLTHDFRPIKESMAESRKVRHAEETSNTQQPSTEQAKTVEQSTLATPSSIAEPSEQPILSKSAIEEVKYTKSGGVYLIPVLINDVLQMKFIIDSGASDVSISPDVVLTLIKTETIEKRDWLPGRRYQLADGSIAQSDRFNIRTLKIGNRILKNVACSISNSIDAPMLLGQSALEQLGNFTFHYETGTVRFQNKTRKANSR